MGYKEQFKDDIFVIDFWTDNESKVEDLYNLINRLRIFEAPILLVGHYALEIGIQNRADYYLFIKDNPLLLNDEFSKYGIDSTRWTQLFDARIENHRKFHHDYAIWESMRHAFKFCQQLGKKHIHFLEYDNLPDEVQYRQAFLEEAPRNDAVIYEYHKGSSFSDNPYCATYIFSIKTDVAIKLVDKIPTKEMFFKNKPDCWQLEKNFLQTLKSITSRIHVSRYIQNNNELNMKEVWSSGSKNVYAQFYLGVDKNDLLYIHPISGTGEREAQQDYLLEIVYGEYKEFHYLLKGSYNLHLMGKYEKGLTVYVYHEGIEIFKTTLDENVDEFRRYNKVMGKNEIMEKTMYEPDEVNVNFIDGPFIEIKDSVEKEYKVQFFDRNFPDYFAIIKSNHWCRPAKKYKRDWKITVEGIDNDYYFEHVYDPTGKRVLISFESKSLGDTLAWIPQVERFKNENSCHVICSTFHNKLFRDQYPEIEFVEPGSEVHSIYALFRIGVFKKDGEFDFNKNRFDPKTLPLGKICSDILGMEYKELKPRLPVFATEKKKVVSIATHGTAQCKYWNNPDGWQEVVDYLVSEGYEVKLLSREEDGYMGNKNPKNVTKIRPGSIENIIKILQESEFFIGISSGLSWVSWAVGTETILISGFTDKVVEPMKGIRRIINKSVCNGCWNKFEFDPGDWNWCPVHKGTDQQFECTKSISGKEVIDVIKGLSVPIMATDKEITMIVDKIELKNIYNNECSRPSDINEHLPTLKKYSDECKHITEMGVRYVVSTYAFMMGKPKKLISYDIDPIENWGVDRNWLKRLAKSNGIDFEFIVGDTTKVEIEETDFLFIDTYHSYTQLKSELTLNGNKVKKYIGFHDTTHREFFGDDGKTPGLWQAIMEFIDENPEWSVHERFTNNNGLTIIKRN